MSLCPQHGTSGEGGRRGVRVQGGGLEHLWERGRGVRGQGGGRLEHLRSNAQVL